MGQDGRTGAALVRRRALAAALVGTLVVGALSACGSSGADATEPAVVATAGADCLAPEVLDSLGLRLDPELAARASHPAAPTPGRVPDDFVPTAVLVCQVGGEMRDGAGTWTAVTETAREGSADDLDRLVTALGEPVDAATPCTADAAPAAVWLVDAISRAVRPSLPLDGCGAPAPAVREALDGLAVTGVVDHAVELVAPAAS